MKTVLSRSRGGVHVVPSVGTTRVTLVTGGDRPVDHPEDHHKILKLK